MSKLLPYSIKVLFFLGLLSRAIHLNAQELEVTNSPPITPVNLISNVFLGEGVEVINVTYFGSNDAVGFFKNGGNSIGIDRGLVMTTGIAVSSPDDQGVDGVGNQFAGVNNQSIIEDNDVDALINDEFRESFNLTKYEIEFIPIADTLRFRYAFASEEYPEFVCSRFNDVFGFFISGPGINGPYEDGAENIALIPGTNLPVTINNVNGGEVPNGADSTFCAPPNGSLDFSEFFNDNDLSSNVPVYDGFTDVFVAEAIVQPCSTYTIKLVISDVSDPDFDSGVFLEAKSFGTGSLKVETITSSLDGSVAEGCSAGVVTFSLPNRVESDFFIDFSISGTATNGLDYQAIPQVLFIPAGDSSISVPIVALEDIIDEGNETLILDVRRDACNRDTLEILIREDPLVPVDLGEDLTICEGEAVPLNGTVPIELPPPPNFTSTEAVDLLFPDFAYTSDIEVQGVIPTVLGPEVVKQVCIDSLTHQWIDDLDIFLITPGGQFMELTTDNGGNGGNGLLPDQYLGTCFTPRDSIRINSPFPFAPEDSVPFTGNWLPEGEWIDLWTGENPTNGTWTLQILDDAPGAEGVLHQWSVCFSPIYSIGYQWEPSDGLNCSDCPNPIASPSDTTVYHLRAIDSYGCMVEDSITINVIEVVDPPLLQCSTSSLNSLSVVWEDVIGSEGYEVRIDGGPWEPANGNLSHIFNGLMPLQSYTIDVRGLADCPGLVASISCSTLDCTPPQINVEIDNVVCQGGNDGMVSITANGGVPPYSFTLDGVTNNTGIFTALPAGTYLIEVQGDDGCPAIQNILVDEPNGWTIDPIILREVSCDGAILGSATVTIDGGLGPYNFLWDNNQMDSIATDLSLGEHFITITDSNGCDSIFRLDVPLVEGFTLEMGMETVACSGESTGRAFVTVVGGQAPFRFLWDVNAGAQTSDTASMLSAGMYTVTVFDANNCVQEGNILVEENLPLDIDDQINNPTCFGLADGRIQLNVSGGSGNYSYNWSNGAETSEVNGLEAGAISVIVMDELNCSDTTIFMLEEPEAISAFIDTRPPRCADANNGEVIIFTSGGTPQYSFNWGDQVLNEGRRSDLAGGNYLVTITDANQCQLELPIQLEAPVPLQVSFSATPVSCVGNMDGQVTASALGGTGNLTYTWENGSSGSTLSNLTTGVYAITITDENSCTLISSVAIEGPEPVEIIIIEERGPSCNGDNDGIIEIVVSGGTGAISFLWNTGSTSQQINNLATGLYTVTVTDENNCTAEASFNLNAPSVLNIEFDVIDVDCYGEATGTINTTILGGFPPYEISWSNQSTEQNLSNLLAGTYTISVTDSNGCTEQADVALDQPEGPLEAMVEITDVSCFGLEDGIIQLIPSGGSPPYKTRLNGIDQGRRNDFIGVGGGVYEIIIEDEKGCIFTDNNIFVEEPIPFSVDLGRDVIVGFNRSAFVFADVFGGEGIFQFQWFPSDSSLVLDCFDCSSTLIRATQQSTLKILVTDGNGCTAEDLVNIFVVKDNRAFVPSGFTPNNDGLNDRLLVHGKSGIKVLSFKIFDRWGEQLYESANFEVNDETTGWDGTFRGKFVESGVYLWVLQVEYEDGTTEDLSGSTTLIR